MKGFGLVFSFVAVAGCSMPLKSLRSNVDPSAPGAVAQIATEPTFAEAPPIVQVRDYWHSAVVTVVAWDEDDAAFGLRTSISRNGEIVGGRQYGDHRLYMSPFLTREMGGFAHATVNRNDRLAQLGWQGDSYACFYGRACSPMMTVGVRLPDSILRSNRDGLTVTFYPRVLDPWTLTLRHELIEAYLAKVDSVVAAMRSNSE